MALIDENESLAYRPKATPLETLSIQELEDHIRSLEAEIEEVRAVIDRKKAHKNGADSLFRTA